MSQTFYSKNSSKNVLKQMDDTFDDVLKQHKQDNLDKLERQFEMAQMQDSDNEDDEPSEIVKKESIKFTDSKGKMTLSRIISEKKNSSPQLIKSESEIKVEKLDESEYKSGTRKMGFLIKASFDNNTAFKRFCIVDKVLEKNQVLFTIWKEEASLKHGEPIMRIFIDKPAVMERKKFVMKNTSMDIEKGTEFGLALRIIPSAGNPFYVWGESEKEIQQWELTIRCLLKYDILSPKGRTEVLVEKIVVTEPVVKTTGNGSFSTPIPTTTAPVGKVSKLREFFSRLIPRNKNNSD
jgi:hypothetical protein